MTQDLNEPVSVILAHNHKERKTCPKSIEWQGRVYPVLKLGLHHTYKKGEVLYHSFSVQSQSIFFRLDLNSKTLNWRLKEVSDGIPD